MDQPISAVPRSRMVVVLNIAHSPFFKRIWTADLFDRKQNPLGAWRWRIFTSLPSVLPQVKFFLRKSLDSWELRSKSNIRILPRNVRSSIRKTQLLKLNIFPWFPDFHFFGNFMGSSMQKNVWWNRFMYWGIKKCEITLWHKHAFNSEQTTPVFFSIYGVLYFIRHVP